MNRKNVIFNINLGRMFYNSMKEKDGRQRKKNVHNRYEKGKNLHIFLLLDKA